MALFPPPFSFSPGPISSPQSSPTGTTDTATGSSRLPLTPPPVSAPDSATPTPGSILSTTTTNPPPESFTSSPTVPTLSTTPSSAGTNTLSTSTDSTTPAVSSPPATTSSSFLQSSSSPSMSAASTSSLSSSSPSPSSTVLPVVATASHSHHAGAIAGGVIGGIALLVAIIAVLLFYRSRHNAISSRIHKWRRRSSAPPGAFSKWDGLSSRDFGLPTSAGGPAAYKTSVPTRHSSTGSTAIMLGGQKSSIGHGTYDYEDEKSPATATPSSHGHEPLEAAPPFNGYTYDFPAAAVPASPSSAAFPPGRPRERATTQDRARAFSSLESGSPRSPPTSPINHYNYNYNRQSLDGRILSSPPTSPSGPRSEAIRMNRTSIGRHPSRKPVPKYDETASELSDMHDPQSPISPSTHTSTPEPDAARSSVYYDSRATPSASSSSSNLHGGSSNLHSSTNLHSSAHAGTSVTAGRSRDDLIMAGYQIPKLTEKTSFGDMRNVHYLIPDPPPASRN